MSKTQLNERNTVVGNLVKYDGKIYELDTIAAEFPTLNTDEFGIGVVDWNNIEPIPLTPEILVRFGFEKYKTSVSTMGTFHVNTSTNSKTSILRSPTKN